MATSVWPSACGHFRDSTETWDRVSPLQESATHPALVPCFPFLPRTLPFLPQHYSLLGQQHNHGNDSR